MKRLLSSYNLDGVKAIAWGINHEEEALNAYRSLGGIVHETGFVFISPKMWMYTFVRCKLPLFYKFHHVTNIIL